MKRSHYSFLMIFAICLSVAACSGSGQNSHSSITILIGASSAASASINSVTFTVSGPGMDEMKAVVTNITPGQPVSTTLLVRNGEDRTFDVAVRDDLEDVIYRGTESGVDLDGKPLTLDITLKPSTIQYGASTDDESYGIATDKDGNVYVIGTVYSTMTTTFLSEVVLTKFDKRGDQQWQQKLGAADKFNEGYSVAIDGTGNVYITGSTNGVVGTDPAVGGTDCFIAKYDSAGTQQSWLHQFGSTGTDFCSGIAVDSSGTAFLTGTTDGTIDGKANTGGYDAFIVKFDSAGNRAVDQTRLVGTSQDDSGQTIAMDASGNIVIAGYTGGTLAGTTNAGLYDLFVAKYDQSGNQSWISQRGSVDDDQAWAVAVDSLGNVFVAGGTYNGLDGFVNADSSGFTSDLFIVKYSVSGAWQWTRQMDAGNDIANGIALDSTGNIYVAGGTDSGIDGNTSDGGYDMFLVKYNANGDKQWTRQRGTTSDDEGMAVTTNSDGSVLVTGYTDGDLDKNINNDSSGMTADVFLMKFDSSGQKQ